MSFLGSSPAGTPPSEVVRCEAEQAAAATELASLPPPDVRWIPRRKAQVISALNRGVINAEEACARYSLSPEELASWQIAATSREGLAALRTTRLVRHRRDTLAGR